MFKALEFDDKISERTETQSNMTSNQAKAQTVPCGGDQADQDIQRQDSKSLILKTNRSGVSDSNPNSGDELIHNNMDSG